MTLATEFFKPEVLFSSDNAFVKSAKKAHELVFESLDKTARLQLDFAQDLLNLNRKRFEALYAGASFADSLTVQQDLAVEAGKRGLTLVDDVQAIATEIQEAVKASADEFVAAANSVAASATKTASKKTKAA